MRNLITIESSRLHKTDRTWCCASEYDATGLAKFLRENFPEATVRQITPQEYTDIEPRGED